MQVYIADSRAKVGVNDNCLVVEGEDYKNEYPIKTVEIVNVLGQATLSTRVLTTLIGLEIPVFYFTVDGHYKFRVVNHENVDARIQKKQGILSSDGYFKAQIAKITVSNKINNQIAILESYSNATKIDTSSAVQFMMKHLAAVQGSNDVDIIRGHEGIAAKAYFSGVAKFMPYEFKFSGRSTRPPRDEFNSMISIGYSHIYQYIIAILEKYGLNAYFGFLHEDRPGHRSLASDIMEEWRPIIVDDTCISLVLDGKMDEKEFFFEYKGGAVFLNKKGSKTVIRKIGEKMIQSHDYLLQGKYKYAFHYALEMQVQRLKYAIEEGDSTLFALENDKRISDVKS